MKVLLCSLCFMLLLSCSPFYLNPEGYEILNEPLEVAWAETAKLKYIPDMSSEDQWKSPYETLEDGGGDCEDIATYMVYLLGPRSSIVEIYYSGLFYHCIVEYCGQYLEPQTIGYYYNSQDLDIIKVMDYWAVMKTTTSHGWE